MQERVFFPMAKRRGNPNWGKPEPIGPVTPTITEFEQVVREYKLSPDQYLRSTRLREWARRNKNSKYIPEPLLEAWGFEIESTL
jgi:predicted metal-binding protein